MKNYHSIIKKARKYLNANRIIAIPTETVYGLAGNAYSDIAVKKIFTLKKRPKNNPLIVHYGKFKKLIPRAFDSSYWVFALYFFENFISNQFYAERHFLSFESKLLTLQ